MVTIEDSAKSPYDGSKKNPYSDMDEMAEKKQRKTDKADPDYSPKSDSDDDDSDDVYGSASANCAKERSSSLDCGIEGCSKSKEHRCLHKRCHYCGYLTADLKEHITAAHPNEDNSRGKHKLRSCPFCGRLCPHLMQHVRQVHRKENVVASMLEDTFINSRLMIATNFYRSNNDNSEEFDTYVVQILDRLGKLRDWQELVRVCRTDEMMMLIGRNLFANVMVNGHFAPLTRQAKRVRKQMLRLARLFLCFEDIMGKQSDVNTQSTESEVLEIQKDVVTISRTPCTRSKLRENQIMVLHTPSTGTEVLEHQIDVNPLATGSEVLENQKDVIMVQHTPFYGSEVLEMQKDLPSAGSGNHKDVFAEPDTPSNGSEFLENEKDVPSTGSELENQKDIVVEPGTPSTGSDLIDNQNDAGMPAIRLEMKPTIIDMFKARNFPIMTEAFKQCTCWVDGDGNVRSKIQTPYHMYHLLLRAATMLRVHFLATGDLVTVTDIAEFQKLMDDNRQLGGDRNPKLSSRSQIKRVLRGKREKDAITLRTYTINRISSLTEDLTSSGYDELRDLCCSHLTLINARRGGIPAELRLSEWTEACSQSEQCESRMTDLSSMEKEAYHNCIMIPQIGKDHVTVPIVVPANIVEAVRKLADPDIRRVSDVHPVNPYLFPSTLQSEGHITGFDAVISACEKADVRWVSSTSPLRDVVTAYTALDLPETRRSAFFDEMQRPEAFEHLCVDTLVKRNKPPGKLLYIVIYRI